MNTQKHAEKRILEAGYYLATVSAKYLTEKLSLQDNESDMFKKIVLQVMTKDKNYYKIRRAARTLGFKDYKDALKLYGFQIIDLKEKEYIPKLLLMELLKISDNKVIFGGLNSHENWPRIKSFAKRLGKKPNELAKANGFKIIRKNAFIVKE